MVIEKDEWWALSLSTLSLSLQFPDGFPQIIPSFWKEKKYIHERVLKFR